MQQNSWVPLFPEQASTFAWEVDALYMYLNLITAFFTIGIVLTIIYFVIRYREREKFANGAEIHGSMALEVTWSFIPFIIAMTIFLGGVIVYYNQYRPPQDTMEIYVVGKQWMWKVQHGTGQREINDLHIPINRKIKLIMTTEDVIHNFAIPDFRTKMDVVPGRYMILWFEATKPGKYRIQCMEYCGLNHSGMGGYVYAMEQHEFDNWLSGNQSNQTPVQAGEELFANRLGCASCHQQNDQGRGPTLNGVFGSQVKLASGQLVTADEEYIRQSILNPQGQIVAGYQPIMPTFKGQLTEEQLVSLVEYIKSLGGNSAGSKGNSTSPTNMPTQGGGNTMGTGNTSTGTGTVAPRANRGDTNSQGSNPNAPPDRPEPTNRPR